MKSVDLITLLITFCHRTFDSNKNQLQKYSIFYIITTLFSWNCHIFWDSIKLKMFGETSAMWRFRIARDEYCVHTLTLILFVIRSSLTTHVLLRNQYINLSCVYQNLTLLLSLGVYCFVRRTNKHLTNSVKSAVRCVREWSLSFQWNGDENIRTWDSVYICVLRALFKTRLFISLVFEVSIWSLKKMLFR